MTDELLGHAFIRYPHLVRRSRQIKFTIAQVRRNGQLVFSIGSDSTLALVHATNSRGFR